MVGAARVLAPAACCSSTARTRRAAHTAPSNEAFDADLRARNPEWGVRDLDDVRALAEQHGFDFDERVAMPANNLSVIFRRR